MYDDLARAQRPSALEWLVVNAIIPSVVLTLALHSQNAYPAARVCYDCSATLPLFVPTTRTLCFESCRLPDVFPILIRMPRPVYPAITRRNGVARRVVLRALVNPEGRVDSTSILVVETTDSAFITPAFHALAQALFRPARYGGHAGAAWIMIGIEFNRRRE